MTVRNLSPATQRSYVYGVAKGLVRFRDGYRGGVCHREMVVDLISRLRSRAARYENLRWAHR